MAVDTRPFGELFAEGTRNGLMRPKAVRGDGVKMVNMGELFAHSRITNVDMDRVPLSHAESDRFLLNSGDLLFARQSLVLEGAGKCSIFVGDDEPVTFESHVTRVRLDQQKGDPFFYFYYLQSHHGKAAIRSIVEQGAGASGIRGSDLQNLDVLWMPLAEQRAIAHILGTLDDKIELNCRRNQTLEDIARALFQDWFVDFGPVRAKMDGREPYLPADLWQFFPDRLDDEGKPEGWREVAAETVADIGIGKTPPRNEHQWFSTADSDVRWVSIRDMGNSGLYLQSTSEYLTSAAVEKFNVRTVPDNTVILSFKLTVGRVAITDGEMVTNEAIAHFKVGGQKTLSTEYLYSYLREFDYGRLGSTSSIATAVNSKSIKALPILVPTNDLAGHFTRRVEPIFARIKYQQSEAETLAQIRDTLLPKVISGELRIGDADRFIAKSA